MTQRPERLKATKRYGPSTQVNQPVSMMLTYNDQASSVKHRNAVPVNGSKILNTKTSPKVANIIRQKTPAANGRISKETMILPAYSPTRKIPEPDSQDDVKKVDDFADFRRPGVPVGFVTRQAKVVKTFLTKMKTGNREPSRVDEISSGIGQHRVTSNSVADTLKVVETSSRTTKSKRNHEFTSTMPRGIPVTQDINKYSTATGMNNIQPSKHKTNAARRQVANEVVKDKKKHSTPKAIKSELHEDVESCATDKTNPSSTAEAIKPILDRSGAVVKLGGKTDQDSENTMPHVSPPNTKSLQESENTDRITSTSTTLSEEIVTGRSTSTAKTKQTNLLSNPEDIVSSTTLKVLVMNASGNADKLGSIPERRRQTIQNIVCKFKPDLVLFQEFKWVGITGKIWSKHPLPKEYIYTGNDEASIMYNSSVFKEVRSLPASDLDSMLLRLQSSSNNSLKRPFPNDFNPISRMCARVLSTSSKNPLQFICISWHGQSNKKGGGSLKELIKIEYFEYWMEYLRCIRDTFKVPMLVGGDYNVSLLSIEKFVCSPFKLCKYEASERRKARGVIDYCIVTDDLELSDIIFLNLNDSTSVKDPNAVLDHDPLLANLSRSTFGFTGAAMGFGKKTSWPSPIRKTVTKRDITGHI